MSKISVTTIAGLTSGGDANKVKIESGDDLEVVSGTTTLGGNTSITGDTATLTLTDSSSHSANTGPAISFFSKDSGGTSREVAKIVGESHSGANEGNLALQTRNGGTLETKWKLFKNGNFIPSNSAYGIVLGNTTSTDANLLDDYEEGTWNPTVGGNATYNNQQGTYTKIGRYVFVRGDFHINAIGTGSTTTLSGLPFTSANLQGTPHGMISVGYFSNLSQNYTSIGGYVLNNSTGMYFSGSTSAATTIQLNGAATITSNTRILFSVSYITAS